MKQTQKVHQRLRLTFTLLILCMVIIAGRLFYWQVIKASSLQSKAQNQTLNQDLISGQRGKIFTAEGNLLVGNRTVYQLFVNKKELEIGYQELVERLVNIIAESEKDLATVEQNSNHKLKNSETNIAPNTQQAPTKEAIQVLLTDRLNLDKTWIKLVDRLSPEQKERVAQEQIVGFHFLEDNIRYYPEGSVAAHLTGFVGKNEDGENVGYFGLEGALNKELQGRQKQIEYRHDGKGEKLADQIIDFSNLDGRDITLTLHRDLQYIAETSLAKGLSRYQGSSGEIVIMDPKSGQILALATWPHYDPLQYSNFNLEDFKNPALTNLYEPGSTFKTITVSAGIDSGAITPETICTKCNGPRKISGYTIKTWNEEYHPNIDMKEALRKSDNIAMIFAAEKIGADRFLDYLHKFGFGEPLDIDLQEDTKTPLPDHLGPVELATVSFGQGISANSLQIVRAVAAIANQGVMMKPYLVKKVHDPLTNETIQYEPQIMRRVISAKTAAQVTEMMVYAAPDRPNWIDQNYTVAGKTGTAQIASQTGGYREEGTIASYIGFAPAENPKFVMLVKLVEPKLSQWGATTAVPIWYEVADKIILRL
jgi:cell division protein FtsI/penicillin-binding protein 2